MTDDEEEIVTYGTEQLEIRPKPGKGPLSKEEEAKVRQQLAEHFEAAFKKV